MKEYYEGIAWYDYLVFLVYNGIFTYLLYRLGDVFYSLQKKTISIFLLLFQFYFFLVLADTFLNFLPSLHDAELYSYMIRTGQYPQASPENILVIYYISLFIGMLCLNSSVIYTFFCIFIFINALMYFIKSWKTYYPFQNEQSESVFTILCFLWPAGVLFTTAPLREAFIFLGFALFLSGFLKFVHEKKWGLLIFGCIALSMFRLQLLLFVTPVLAVLFLSKLKIRTTLKATIFVVSLVIILLFIRYVLIKEQITPEVLTSYRNMSVERSIELPYGNVNWHSYSQICIASFFLILQFLFTPMPIFVQHDPLNSLLPFLDFIFLVFLLLIILTNIKNIFKNKKALLALLVFYILLFGTSESDLLDAVRHRMPLEIIFLLLIAEPLSLHLSKKKLT